MLRITPVIVATIILSISARFTFAAGAFPAFPQEGQRIGGALVSDWVTDPAPNESSFDVFCGDIIIGQISVQFAAGTFDNSTPQPKAGAYIRFGFQRNDNKHCEEGEVEGTYRWIQEVTTDAPLGGKPANQPFVDYAAGQTGNPYYSQRDVGRFGFTTATDDRPLRNNGEGVNVNWMAELALVCESLEGEIHVIGALTYGFKVTDGAVTGVNPSGFGNLSGKFLETLKADPNSAGYTIEEGCCCTPVPLPASVWMGVIGLPLVALAQRFVRNSRPQTVV